MDIDRIKALYDKVFKDKPGAMEKYVTSRLMGGFMRPKSGSKCLLSPPRGYNVIFEYDDTGHIIDMRFERSH